MSFNEEQKKLLNQKINKKMSLSVVVEVVSN